LKVVSICERRDVAYFGTDSGDLTKVTVKFTASLLFCNLGFDIKKNQAHRIRKFEMQEVKTQLHVTFDL
jgi:hypothetical protein